MSDNKYSIDYGSRVAGCKKCKAKMEKGALRWEFTLGTFYSWFLKIHSYHGC